MIDIKDFAAIMKRIADDFHQVIPFDAKTQKIALLDLSPANANFSQKDYESTETLSQFINQNKKAKNANFLIGGYREERNMYRRSNLFDKNVIEDSSIIEEPRNMHLGIDVWGDAGTPIYAALGGMVHSYAYNDNFGDYGATIILQHQVDMLNFYTLYGHLSLTDIAKIRSGQFITRGEKFAHFGSPEENGNWPPHLHFQVIFDMGILEGDYPGVCKKSEAEKYFANSPDPDSILNLLKYT